MFDSVQQFSNPTDGMTKPGNGTGNTGAGAGDSLVLDLDNASITEFEAIPPGIYAAKVENTEFGDSSNGNPMVTVSFRITEDGPYIKRLVFNHYTLSSDFGKAALKIFLQRLCPEYPLTGFSPSNFCENMVAVNRPCRVKLGVKMYQGQRRNQVKEVLEAGTADRFFQ
jgi:hypothetical protein